MRNTNANTRTGRPDPGFRLNAPQAESSAEHSGAFAELGDELEDPHSTSSDPFGSSRSNNNNNSNNNQSEQANLNSQSNKTSGDSSLAAPNGGAYPQQEQQQQQQEQRRAGGIPLKCLIVVGIIVILLLIGLIVAVIMTLGTDNNNNNNDNTLQQPPSSPAGPPSSPAGPPSQPSGMVPTLPPTMAPSIVSSPVNQGTTPEPKTTLGRVYQRGYLKCGVADGQPGFSEINLETGIREGFDAEMCRAVAAAMFGELTSERVEFVPVTAFERFQRLVADDYDVLIRTTTHTMERQVLESTTGDSFRFSVPYLYNGLQFAGLPPYVECADNLTVTEGTCQDTTICALDGTTHVSIITSKIPNAQIISAVGSEFLYNNFIQGFCNVIAGEQFDIAETILRERGYVGNYTYGTKVHSKEPLCFVTRDDDTEWSDFVHWVLQALLAAEDESITQRTASIIQPTNVFGDNSVFANAFRNAVQAVGNYGEVYRRTLESLLPRPVPDRINGGDSGLIYAFPFGSVEDVVASGPGIGSTLDEIKSRGFLKCGISRRVIFAQFDATNQTWDGFDVDFCRALSAAIFDGETETIVYTDLPASERFEALDNGNVDVLSRLTTVTLSRDINEPSTGVGFSFSQPYFYDGLTFGGIPPFAGCADRLDVTSISCRDLLVCVNQGTTFESRLQTLFPERFIVPRQSGELTVEALVSGQCNVIAGGVVDVSLTNIRSAGYQGPYQTGSNRYSKDPLALVTREDDPMWSNFVFWIVTAIFYAEEQGITQQDADSLPTVTLFGPLYFGMFRRAVEAVGNYGEIYARQAQADVPRGGLNELNELLSGPQHYPFPGVV